MQVVFNPLTGVFDALPDSPVSTPLSFRAVCHSSDAVGACVCISGTSGTSDPSVATADITDITKMPAVGVILRKLSSTLCVVAYLGSVTKSGLTPGGRYFVGADGLPTATRPTGPALVQVIGVALDATRLFVQPSRDLVKVIS